MIQDKELNNLAATERFLRKREEERNARITKILTGRRKPPDESIILALKKEVKNEE